MSSPPGRRGNGLPAAEWGALVDLDPRLSQTMLERLAAAEVAAYVEPASGVDPTLRAAVLPERPLDRLYVDPARAETARSVVSAEVADLDGPDGTHGLVRPVPRGAAGRVLTPPLLPAQPTRPSSPRRPSGPRADGPGDPGSGARRSAAQDDEAFAAIVARWDDSGPSGAVPRWPVTEDLDEPSGRGASSSSRALPPPAGPGQASGDAPAPGATDDLPTDAAGGQLRRRRSDPPDTPTNTPADTPPATPPGTPADATAAPPRDPLPGLPAWVEPAALDDDGHYEPPPPPPVPRLRARTVLAVLSVVLGVLVLLVPGRLGLVTDGSSTLIGLLLLGGGAGALVSWVRDSSGPDDGAVV